MRRKAKKPKLSAEAVASQLELARVDSEAAVWTLIHLYRPYLLAIAGDALGRRLQAKVGASDLVQEVFLIAYRRFTSFEGRSEPELRRWLRGILLNVARDWRRRFLGTKMRSTARERSLDDFESRQLLRRLAAVSSKSPGSALDFKNQLKALEAALERLPESYRQVIVWHNYRNQTFVKIGAKIDRSPDAVRMLWNRAIRRLAQEMRPEL